MKAEIPITKTHWVIDCRWVRLFHLSAHDPIARYIWGEIRSNGVMSTCLAG